MGTRPAGSESRFRRGVAIVTALVAIGGLTVFASVAGAAPQPTVAQVQAKVNQLTSQYDKVTEQLDQVGEQLSAAQTRLAQVRTAVNHANAQFRAAQTTVAQIAAATFEDTGATSIAGVLTSGDPSVVLQEGSLLMALSGNRNAETTQLLTDASQLAGVEQEQQRTESGIAALKTQLADHKNSLGKLIATEQATLDSLTVPQQQTVKSNTIGANGSTQKVTYTGPTGSQAARPSRSSTRSSAARTCTAGPDRARWASTAPGWPRPRGAPRAWPSRVTATSSGPSSRTSRSPRSSRATC